MHFSSCSLHPSELLPADMVTYNLCQCNTELAAWYSLAVAS